MRTLRSLALLGGLCLAGVTSLVAMPSSYPVARVAVGGVHAQVVVAEPGLAVGWYEGRYWDGYRYWDRAAWYAAHPGWRGGWGPGWAYRPEVIVAGPGLAVGWYGGRYWDREAWFAAHPGWHGGWGPGWHYRR